MNIGVNLTPLFIKKPFIKLMGKFVAASSTSTLSNIGIIDIEEKYKKYIDNIYVIVKPGDIQKIKCTVCSFKDKLNITINSNIENTKFIKIFQNNLKKHLK